MREYLEKRLFGIEPRFFTGIDDPKSSLMMFGFECGDGWFPLIEELLLAAKQRVEAGEWKSFRVVQVKEKFGGLRFYYEGGDERFAGMVEMAERLSFRICEACGAWATETRITRDPETGEPRGYWVATLCAEHHRMRDSGLKTGEVLSSSRSRVRAKED